MSWKNRKDANCVLFDSVPDTGECDVAAGDVLILACDGLFDVMENEEVGKRVHEMLGAGEPLEKICEKLTTTAIEELGSDDNVSVVLVKVPEK